MKKLLFVLPTFLFVSCINLASPQNNIVIIKIQVSDEDQAMTGSKLEDIAKGLKQEGGDITAPIK